MNSYSFTGGGFSTKKLKHTFAEEDIFGPELEAAFAGKLEGPFGDLLHHKLISNDEITISRKENLLIRKFLMVNALRSPFTNGSWDEMIERTHLEDHPSVLMFLDMETEEFVFHDYNRIRDSFWYYDNMAKMALKKKHDFSRLI